VATWKALEDTDAQTSWTLYSMHHIIYSTECWRSRRLFPAEIVGKAARHPAAIAGAGACWSAGPTPQDFDVAEFIDRLRGPQRRIRALDHLPNA
jgi:hypothetical protein